MSRIYKTLCPCRNCAERHVACHSSCTKYKEWKDNSVEEPISRTFSMTMQKAIIRNARAKGAGRKR